jgi:acyl-CoA thioesterase FadM
LHDEGSRLETDAERFELRISTGADDTDEMGHVNNVVYVR